MSIREFIGKTEIRGILAIIIVIGGGYILCLTSIHNDIKFGVFGLMNLVGGFYFASSQGSEKKSETISKALDK